MAAVRSGIVAARSPILAVGTLTIDTAGSAFDERQGAHLMSTTRSKEAAPSSVNDTNGHADDLAAVIEKGRCES